MNDTPGVPANVRDRIIHAAYTCFERYGVQKTTMDDVAKTAGCSRQTVYKNFLSKDDLVSAICLIESDKLNIEIHKHVHGHSNLADKMTQSILVALRIGRENPYIARLLEPLEVRARLTEKDDPVHAMQRERWGPLLHEGIRAGVIAPDLDLDEVVSWLTLAQMALLVKFGVAKERATQERAATAEPTQERTTAKSVPADDAQLEHMIRRFIVAPLFLKE